MGVRITPAYAGKSVKLKSIRANRQDHPRIRGEKETSTQLLQH